MKILFLTSAFNGMAQRAWIELDRLNHQVKVRIVDDAAEMERAVREFQPELIVAPYLKTKIPPGIYENYTCLIIHPGVKGDRGASSLDWAILNGEQEWGVTILQAAEKMDAGDIWASHTFPMRPVSKACLYRHEVTQTAIKGLIEAVNHFQTSGFKPEPPDAGKPDIRGKWNRSTRPDDFRFSWEEPAKEILTKIHAGDSTPGVPVEFFGKPFYGFGGHLEAFLKGKPGEILARRDQAVCIAAGENAVWLTHLKSLEDGGIKLPAALALGKAAAAIPESPMRPFAMPRDLTWREIYYREESSVGYLHFDFYNGAMNTGQCHRLRETFLQIKQRPVKVIVLMGGHDLWSNGIHLNVIEHAKNPADESWKNINALNDLIREIILCDSHYIISAMQGNAGAGGVPFALAADKVLARNGIVLNPHTKNMGLYGSEYWTYLLPRRIGVEKATRFTEDCLPWGTVIAKEIGLIDDCFGETAGEFRGRVKAVAREIVNLPYFDKLLLAKRFQRRKDEAFKPLEKYRSAELARMRKNFYENDEDYHFKRYCFVHKIYDAEGGKSFAEKDWYSSRRTIYRRRKWESINYGN